MKLMIIYKSQHIMVFAIVMFAICGCKKYLDVKPDKNLVVPTTQKDVQALLDNYSFLNQGDAASLGISGEEYTLTDEVLNSVNEDQRRTYKWEKDNLFIDNSDWFYSYRIVYIANTALETIEKYGGGKSNLSQWNELKGQALFFRAKSFLQNAWIWSLAYDPQNSRSDLGIPLRLESDFNIPSKRSTVTETYDQVIKDLKKAASYLPSKAIHVMRPSKAAAFALLARTYLSMREYEQATLYADSCLQIYSTLLDYNTLNPSASTPFIPFNTEVIFESRINSLGAIAVDNAIINSDLIQSYLIGDLRKTVFFKDRGNNVFTFKGSYEGTSAQIMFTGLATDEVYLIRAEGNARAGKVALALDDLNTLLSKRWDKNIFKPLLDLNADQALKVILDERRKELLMRNLRWMDIKRLNKEGANIYLQRLANGTTYILAPNDLRFALPLPNDLIGLTGLVQNPR